MLGLIPISSASSSMHSWSIMVELMSAISSFFRRPGALHRDVDRLRRKPRSRQSPLRFPGRLPAIGQSRGRMPPLAPAIHGCVFAPTKRAAICARLSEMARAFGIGNEGGDERHGRRADRFRAMGSSRMRS